ncbi:MAG: L,D-transpeptidase family protein [Alphaproteobacteria bacterium]|nr:L,D-transpeptidase family protein [Alphaproteobacteria bacterium]
MRTILALPLALAAVAALPVLAAAQASAGHTAESAQLIATRASDAFERIDPDAEMPLGDDSVTAGLAGASRNPAVRVIANEMVQPLPKPAATPTPSAVSKNDPFVIKSILPIEGSIRYGDWFWDESAAPKAGKLVVTVDLDARVISAFRDGHEIGTAVALLGTQSHPTPLGTFPILTKEKDNISEKYNNAPMPHTLRLTWDGIAIHGSPVMNGYASHGCVAVPDEFAAKLFAAAKRGDKVIITRGKMVSVGDKVL